MSRKRRVIEEEGLNLVPVMNLVTILIPFLLMSAQFVALAVIDSTLPAIVNNPTPVEEDEEDDKLNLSLLVTASGYTIAGGDKVLDKEDEENGPVVPCIDAGCSTPESYDYTELTRRLVMLKDRYPEEENVILVPDPTIPYEVLVLTMDATRNDPDDIDDENKARVLFPNVVIAGGVE
jgi:biopolymer transport protein ExbD